MGDGLIGCWGFAVLGVGLIVDGTKIGALGENRNFVLGVGVGLIVGGTKVGSFGENRNFFLTALFRYTLLVLWRLGLKSE